VIVAAAMGAVETQSCMLCSFVFFGALPHALASVSRRSSGVLCTRWGSAHLSIGRCRPREVSSVAVHGRASRLVHHFVCEFNSLHFIQSPPRLPPFVMLHSCERLRFMKY
jgi:hypothetical protein